MFAEAAQRNSALHTPPIPDRAVSASRELAAGTQASQQKRAAQQLLQSTFGTIKAQTLSNQVELVLVFIIIRWSRFDGSPLGILRPNKKCQPSILL